MAELQSEELKRAPRDVGSRGGGVVVTGGVVMTGGVLVRRAVDGVSTKTLRDGFVRKALGATAERAAIAEERVARVGARERGAALTETSGGAEVEVAKGVAARLRVFAARAMGLVGVGRTQSVMLGHAPRGDAQTLVEIEHASRR